MDEMTSHDIDGWDSLAHLNLVIAMERRFGIKFTMAEITQLRDDGRTVGHLIELVNSKRT